MRTVRKPKIVFKYISDKSPEKKKESERRLEGVYNILFDIAAKNLRKKKS